MNRDFLTPKEKQILFVLDNKTLYVRQIAMLINSMSSNVVEMLKILEDKQFIAKKAIKRKTFVTLTDKGKKYVELLYKERLFLLDTPDYLGDM